MVISTARISHQAAQRRYRATAKGQAAEARYAHSPKGRARYIRYRVTERGHLLRRLQDTRADVLLKKRLYMQEAHC